MVVDVSCGPYPTDKLVGLQTALVLFSAAFGGMNDAAWIADAGLQAVCVDTDGEKLEEMRETYPENWAFVRWDAYQYVTEAQGQMDVVSCDPFTNEFDRCADNIESWCQLARHVVILGTGTHTVVEPPAGWEITDVVKRSEYAGGVFWSVLERA